MSTKHLLFALLMLLIPLSSLATEPAGISIKTANLSRQLDTYLLNARINYQLSEEAVEALHNGITLTFNVDLSIIEPRAWLWNKHLSNIQLAYQIKYHTLSEIYQISRHHNNTQQNFSSLDAALYAIGNISDTPIHAITSNKQASSEAVLTAYLNIEALPLPMRPLAYFTPGWHLQSDHYLWPFKQ